MPYLIVQFYSSMFDYASVAVEIWHQILLECIDVPYVLDTLVDKEESHWRTQDLYHDEAVYKASEKQRKGLRLVCRAWQAFADDHRYRWVTYDPIKDASSVEWGAMMDLLRSPATSSRPSGGTNRPRRILFHIRNQEDMQVFWDTINRFSNKVTTLFVESEEGYQDMVYEHLIRQRVGLSQLRCLMVKTPRFYPMPLSSLSRAFPELLALAIKHTQPNSFTVRDFNDKMVLPMLESLDMDLSEFQPAALEAWNLRGLVHLSTAISQRHVESAEMAFYPAKIHGSGLVFFNLYRLDIRNLPVRLPNDFWTWCPCLIEMRLFLSAVYFDAPVPVNHPLKYLVHWPAAFLDIQVNTHVLGSEASIPVILHNLQLLPPGFEAFIVSVNWARYHEVLSVRYNEEQRDRFLIQIQDIAENRSIRVEDHGGVVLGDFLAKTRRTEGISC